MQGEGEEGSQVPALPFAWPIEIMRVHKSETTRYRAFAPEPTACLGMTSEALVHRREKPLGCRVWGETGVVNVSVISREG